MGQNQIKYWIKETLRNSFIHNIEYESLVLVLVVELVRAGAYCGVDDIPVAGRGEVVEEEEEGQGEESGEYG